MTSARPHSRLYVAGHRGLIGSAILRRLALAGAPAPLTRTHSELDLTDAQATERFFDAAGPELVILAAGRVGGIGDNQRFPADFIDTNLAIQLNVFRAARRTGVRRLIFLASSCMYPRECPQPMAESALLTGKPEATSLSYAMAKLAGVQMCLAYNQQLGESRFIPLIPNNTYGPNDNFDPASGHVLAALVHRFAEAQRLHLPEVRLWGSGRARREFIFADDVADACLRLLDGPLDNLELPLNVGTGRDCTIADLACRIADAVGYRGRIAWDPDKPDGAPQKLLDSQRLRAWGWQAETSLEDGLHKTIAWYRQNHPQEQA